MVAMMVRVEHVTDRLVGRLLDRFDDVARFLGEVSVNHHDVVVKHDPDVIAAAKGYVGAFRSNRGITEEDAGGDFLDLVEVNLGDRLLRAEGYNPRTDQD